MENFKVGDILKCGEDLIKVVECTNNDPCDGCYFVQTASCPDCGWFEDIHFELVEQCSEKE